MHVAGVAADPATFEHIDPAVVGNAREVLISELSGKGTVLARAPRCRDRARRRRRRAGGRARQGARAPGLPLRGRGRVVRAAAAQGDRRVRAAVPPRVVAGDRREARRRPRRDRGDDQDLGRRRALRPHRRGQRPGATRSTARCATRWSRSIPHLRDIDLVNFKVRILDETKGTGAVTRVLLDASDGDARVGLDRGLRERDRGLLGGARRLARVRDAGRRGPEVRARPLRRLGRERTSRPAARAAVDRRRPKRSGCSRCCGRDGCRSGRCLASSSGHSRRMSARRSAAPCRAAPPACTWRCGRLASAMAPR